MKKKKIVCFGGGSAMPKVVLEELKKYDVEITSVTSMVDDGGSTGQLRSEFDVLPPGDIRRHILALSNAPDWKKELWNFRFGNESFAGGHKGHSFANVLMAGLEKNLKKYGKVLDWCYDFMEIKKGCMALPATIEKVTLFAETEDGKIIKGESNIDVCSECETKRKIKKIFLEPKAKAYEKVLEKIKKADVVLIGPGDLYSSILPCFLPSGINSEIKKSKASKVFICNIMNKKGETYGFTVEDFSLEVEKYIGCKLDFVIYNRKKIEEEELKESQSKDCSLLNQVVFTGECKGREGNKFIPADILKKDSVSHDSKKLVKKIIEII